MMRGDAARKFIADLDAIDWRSMRHAYGPAEDVPDMLLGLLSDDAEQREEALDGLLIAVHQSGAGRLQLIA